MRWATLLLLATWTGCTDLRGFEGEWAGARVGDSDIVRVGGTPEATALLTIADVDRHGLRGHLTVDLGSNRMLVDADIASLEGAEADVLATMSTTGSPLRVYLAFAPITDLLGDATVLVSLYDGPRVEVRMLRGSPRGPATPIYAIFALSRRD